MEEYQEQKEKLGGCGGLKITGVYGSSPRDKKTGAAGEELLIKPHLKYLFGMFHLSYLTTVLML